MPTERAIPLASCYRLNVGRVGVRTLARGFLLSSPACPLFCEMPMPEFDARDRTRVPGIPIPQHIIPYDPAMAALCGGVAAGVVFCWLESLFLSPPQTPETITKPVAEWKSGVGMRQQYFSRAFNRVGVVYMSQGDRNAAKLAGREFWSERRQCHVFYSMELIDNCTRGVVRRNAFEVDHFLGKCDREPIISAYPASKISGKSQAKGLARKLAL
jgi:hypothetical protein